MSDELPSERGSRPVPDPTLLTTEALHRTVGGLRELLESQIDANKRIAEERLTRIDQQFRLVEQQRVEQKADTKNAVDAALIAQKEAVKEQTIASEKAIVKSEVTTSRQLDQLNITISTAISAIDTAIGDIKERLTRIESGKLGGKEAFSTVYVIIGLVVSAVSVIVFVAFHKP